MTILNNSILKILQILFYTFPLSFVLGNLAINLMVFLIIVVGLINYNKDLIKIQNNYIFFIIISFFIIILFSSYYNYFFVEANQDAIKSVLYLRYLFFLLIIRALVIHNHVKINYFLNVCLLLSFSISLDILIQSLIGKNILGNDIIEFAGGIKYHTGIFGSELIAGGFIFMFSTIGIFATFNIFKRKKKITNILIFFVLILFFLIAIVLSGNRMPLLMFIFFLISFTLIYKKKEKIYFVLLAIIMIFSLSFAILNSDNLVKRLGSFKMGIPNPVFIIDELKKDYPDLKKYENSGKQFHNLKEFKSTQNYTKYPFYTGHLTIYITSVDLFLDKPIIGGGIKSFRNNCSNKVHLPNRVCENHPHNYILEILNDTGLIGLGLIFSFVFYLLFNNYKDYRFGDAKKSNISNWIYLAIILSLLMHFFPIKSSGSFFSTFNSSFIFLILGISLGLNDFKYKNGAK